MNIGIQKTLYFQGNDDKLIKIELFNFIFRLLFGKRAVEVWVIRVLPNFGPVLQRYKMHKAFFISRMKLVFLTINEPS